MSGFTEWKSDHFLMRYGQRCPVTVGLAPNGGGGSYWRVYGIRFLQNVQIIPQKFQTDVDSQEFVNLSGNSQREFNILPIFLGFKNHHLSHVKWNLSPWLPRDRSLHHWGQRARGRALVERILVERPSSTVERSTELHLEKKKRSTFLLDDTRRSLDGHSTLGGIGGVCICAVFRYINKWQMTSYQILLEIGWLSTW